MRFYMCIFVLILQVCCVESHSHYRRMRRARFKDAFLDAKRAAEDDFTDTLLGRERRSVSRNGHNRRHTDVQKLLEDFEIMVYARRLSSLLKKRSCTEWWCMSDKATSKTVPTTTTPPETPPVSSSKTTTTTKRSTVTTTSTNNTLVSVVVTLTTPESAATTTRVSVVGSFCWISVMIQLFH